MIVKKLEEYMIKDCVDLFISTFSKEPWNDVERNLKIMKLRT